MTLQTRAWVTAAVLVVLAVAGEFVGAARRRILRREVSDGNPPPLLAGQILVKVKGPDGRPVPQAVVVQIIHSPKPGVPSGARQFLGMTAGFVVFNPLETAGSVRWVEVSGAADTADQPLPFGAVLTGPVPEGAGLLEVVLPLERTISGSILRGGNPVPGVKVKARLAYPAEFEFLSGAGNDAWQAEARTAAGGRFLLGRLGVGPQEVVFETPAGFAIADGRFESGGTLDIDLAAGRTDTVTVADGSGVPIPNAAVNVVDPGPGYLGVRKSRARGITGRDGIVRFHGLDPARKYRLIAVRTGMGGGGAGEERDWTPSDTIVSLGSLRSVSVRVRDEKGAPHAGVAVTAFSAKAGRPGVTGTTGKDGRCVLQGLDAGPLRVTVKDACSLRSGEAARSLEVGAEEQEAPFTLARGTVLSVKVVGPSFNTMRAVLRDEASGAAAVSAYREGMGLVSWHSVDPDAAYSAILVDTARGMAARVEGIRASDPTRTVKLGPGTFLMVHMQWPAGAGDLKVVVPWGDQPLVEATRYSDALWQIPCLPTGKWTVEASCTVPGSKGRARTAVEAQAGTTISIQVK